MGCVVNGPGEAREADLGVASGNGKGQIFVKGEVIKTVPESQIVETLVEEALRLAEEMGVDLPEELQRASARPSGARSRRHEESGEDEGSARTSTTPQTQGTGERRWVCAAVPGRIWQACTHANGGGEAPRRRRTRFGRAAARR